MNEHETVLSYCEAYDWYHKLFAWHRLHGWDGMLETGPPALREAHDVMAIRFNALHEIAGMGPKPNYVEEAKQGI